MNPPPGFELLKRGGPFFGLLGPIYHRRLPDAGLVIALRVEGKHTNMRGIAHGGMLATLCDAALGINLSMSRQPPQSMVTVNLSTDFIEAARPGDWLEAHVHLRKTGRRLAFAECVLQVDGRVIARATGVFSTVAAPVPAPAPPLGS